MRRGELLGLRWYDVDLDDARLRVEQQLVPTLGGVSFGPPKSPRSRRTLALDAETVNVLRRHRDAQMVERALAGDAYEDLLDLVFCEELGRPIRPQRLTDRFRELRKAAGLTVGSVHWLRHSYITAALTSGTPLHVVAGRVGDTSTTILKVYAHLLPTSDAAAGEHVASLLAR